MNKKRNYVHNNLLLDVKKRSRLNHNWDIIELYEHMILNYGFNIGGETKFGVPITEEFIDILKKRLTKLKGI